MVNRYRRHSRMPRRLACLLLAGLAAVPSFGTEIPKLEDWTIESSSETFATGGVAVLEVDQALGDVRIKGVEVDEVTVTMTAQRHRDDPRRPTIRRDGEGLSLAVAFVETGPAGDAPEDETWSRRRIDIGVQMPKGLDLVVRTGSGRIEVEGVEGTVELSTETGDVFAEIERGGFQASSQQGAIRAKVMSTRSDQPVVMRSVNGSLWVQLLEGASAQVRVESSNLIATDYTMEIDRESGRRFKRGRATVGEGRRMITLSTVNGQARVSNVIVEEAAAPGE